MKLTIRFFFGLLFIPIYSYSMDGIKTELNLKYVDSLRSLALNKITNSIAYAASQSVPLNKIKKNYIDLVNSDCSVEIERNFIYTYGIKHKMNSIKLTAHTAGVSCLTQDNNYLYSGSDDRTLKIWNKKTGTPIHNLSGHTESIFSLALDKNTQTLYSGASGSIKIWDLKKLSCIATLNLTQKPVWAIKYSKMMEKLYSCSADCTIKIWDIEKSVCINTLQDHQDQVASIGQNNYEIYSGSMGH